jgi:hypothetical protein
MPLEAEHRPRHGKRARKCGTKKTQAMTTATKVTIIP